MSLWVCDKLQDAGMPDTQAAQIAVAGDAKEDCCFVVPVAAKNLEAAFPSVVKTGLETTFQSKTKT